MPISHSKAINAALANDWDKAILYNEEILFADPENIEALNRIAFAYTKTGNYEKACLYYKQVLDIDPYNLIAQKNFQKYKHLHNNLQISDIKKKMINLSPSQFLEEPGKTKVINLVNVAPQSTLILLSIGQIVEMNPKRFSIEIRDDEHTYIGALPDDLSFHLRKLLEQGYKYDVFIKGVSKNSVTVFIREMKRSKQNKFLPTFSTDDAVDYYPYVRSELLSPSDEGLSSDEPLEEEV